MRASEWGAQIGPIKGVKDIPTWNNKKNFRNLNSYTEVCSLVH